MGIDLLDGFHYNKLKHFLKEIMRYINSKKRKIISLNHFVTNRFAGPTKDLSVYGVQPTQMWSTKQKPPYSTRI